MNITGKTRKTSGNTTVARSSGMGRSLLVMRMIVVVLMLTMIIGGSGLNYYASAYGGDNNRSEKGIFGISGKSEESDDKANVSEDKDAEVDAESDEESKADEKAGADTKTQESENKDYFAGELSAKVNGATITVEVPSEARLPKDVSLNVKEIKEKNILNAQRAEYKKYMEQAQELLQSQASRKATGGRFFDISFNAGSTGISGLFGSVEELEPAAPVKVTIEYEDAASLEDGQDISIVHLPEDADNTVTEASADVKDGALTFTADSFSVYGVLYTVDFWYGEYEYHLNGEGEIMVSALLKELGLLDAEATGNAGVENTSEKQSIRMADVVDVRFSDESLVKVTREDQADGTADWKLTSLKAFDSEETLTIETKDGVVEFRVTDAQNICAVYKGTTLVGQYTKIQDAIANGVGTDGVNYTIKMLVPSYTTPTNDMNDYNIPSNKWFTLTTATVAEGYTGTDGTSAVINTAGKRLSYTQNGRRNVHITLENIVLDGGYLDGKNTADYGGFFKSRCPGYELTLNSGAILRNTNITGAHHGGAIDLDEGTLTINDGAIIENCNAAADDAGAIHTHGGVVANINGGIIRNCSAGRYGGAICIAEEKCVLNIKGGTIENCKATTGGAVYVFSGATLNMSGGTIKDCTASSTYGGAISMPQKGTVKITGGKIEGCKSKNSGGAIYLGDGVFSMENATLSGNQSENGSGGLIYITKVSSAVNINNCTIEKCTALNGTGGVFMLNGTGITLTVDSTTFSQDKAKIGGIVHLQADSTITINNSIIDACEATGVDGGAIKLASGTIDVKNSEIKNCKAKTIGGAVWAGGGKLTLENSKVG